MKSCSQCGKERPVGRKMCSVCFRSHKQQYARDRYKTHGRHMYQHECAVCSVPFSSCRVSSVYCRSCRKLKPVNNGGYEYSATATGRLIWRHRELSEALLGRRLRPNEHVHHIDGNGKNNQLRNLLIISVSDHISLHQFLNAQYRAMLLKNSIMNIENCWNSLIAPMTTAWLETTGAKVVKLWEIGQPAAEPLVVAEGSETMHDTPDHSAEGDDIVQTTTARASES